MNNSLGLYIHVPFCAGRCSYCNFYSSAENHPPMDEYCASVIKQIGFFGEKEKRAVDTVYFGGGTPSLLGAHRIARILDAVRAAFDLLNPEITIEANPASNLYDTFVGAAAAGVNRVSLGVQSAAAGELKALSRRHDNDMVKNAVSAARKAGIDNISLDLMLGIPYQTRQSLKQSIQFLVSLKPNHISSYILKVEPGTAIQKGGFAFPDDDKQAALYLDTIEQMEKYGYLQYEVSNFAKPGYESRHNMRYWELKDYIGIGPSAHSFLNGRRFYCEPDLKKFIECPRYIPDGNGGGFEEYVMLSLRLKKGMSLLKLKDDYNIKITDRLKSLLNKLCKEDMAILSGDNFALKGKGFLISNSIIVEIISALEE